MKLYDVVTRFKGTQDGHGDGAWFEVGTALLSDSLADVALKAGFVKAAKGVPVEVAEGAVEEIDAAHVADSPLPEDRETKVEAPAETKPKKPFAKKAKA